MSPSISRREQVAGTISIDQAARLLLITGDRVRQLQRGGYIAKGGRGRVLLAEAVQGYIRFLEGLAARPTKTASDSRVRDARANEIEMRNAHRMGELIPIDDATEALEVVVGLARKSLRGIGARVTSDIDVRQKIEAEVSAAQRQMIEALRTASRVARKGGELPYTDADR